MIKFLHCADVHLDTPFSVVDRETSDVRSAQLRGTFASMMLYIRTSGIRLVLIAGDLFSAAYVSAETLQLLKREFASVPECHFVIAPGNHDAYTPDSPYARVDFSENVHIFKEPSVQCIPLYDLGIRVYGFAHTENTQTGAVLADFVPPEDHGLNLFCGHVSLSDGDGVPYVTKEQLAGCGFAYAALGHCHNSTGMRRIGQTYFGYAGCLEGRNFGESGYKGAVCGEIGRNDETGEVQFSVRRLRFSRKHYETEAFDVSDCNDTEEVLSRIRARVTEKGYDRETALEVVMTGTVRPDIFVSEKQLSSILPPLLTLKLRDQCTPPVDLSTLEADPTLRGAFYRELKKDLESTLAAERETAFLALRVGLYAMNCGNFEKWGL